MENCDQMHWYQIAHTFFTEDRLVEALSAARASFCAYWILYKSNTEPLLEIATEVGEQILEIDTDALSDCLDSIFSCMYSAGLHTEFDATLARVSGAVKGDGWKREIAYFYALGLTIQNRDDEAWNLLPPIEEILRFGKMKLLTLTYELAASRVGYTAQERIRERILELDDAVGTQLQYLVAGATSLLGICDYKGAEVALRNAIVNLRPQVSSSDDIRVRLLFANSCRLLGMCFGDRATLAESIVYYAAILDSEFLTKQGQAEIRIEYAEALGGMGDTTTALVQLRTVCDGSEELLPFVLLGERLIEVDEIREARRCLESASKMNGSVSNREDYAFALARLAVVSRDSEDMEIASKALDEITPATPLMRERVSKFKLAISRGSLAEQPKGGFWRAANSIVMLQPNAFGCGINLNAWIERIWKKP